MNVQLKSPREWHAQALMALSLPYRSTLLSICIPTFGRQDGSGRIHIMAI